MTVKNIVFIDSRVSNYQSFIADLADQSEVFVLDSESDGLAQMVARLQGRSGIDAIHVISHGSQGALYLGSTVLDNDRLASYSVPLASIGSSLTDTGDILLYGCNVAQGDVGLQFITSLAQYTGADVAASDDATGAEALGGDWVLEQETDEIELKTLNVSGILGILVSNTPPTFHTGGADGKVVTNFDSNSSGGYAVTLQTDGKILVVGYEIDRLTSNYNFAVARYYTDGGLDSSFNGDGKLTTSFGSFAEQAYSVVVQGDGKILVAGTGAVVEYSNQFAIARYNPDGSLDANFSEDGKLTTSMVLGTEGSSIGLQNDGKILLAGTTYNPDRRTTDIAVARYNSDGSLDTSFDGDGKVTIDASFQYSDRGNSLIIRPDGKILVAGYTEKGHDIVLARLNGDGSLDTTLDGDGLLTTDFGGNDIGNSVVLQIDGKIIIAGESEGDFSLARYYPNGSLDTTFSSDGKLTTNFGTTSDRAMSVTLQLDGKILVAGNMTVTNGLWAFAIARYNTDGSLDSTFDGDGTVITDFGNGAALSYSVKTQTDGKILVAGWSMISSDLSGFAVARYNSDGSLDSTFDSINTLNADVRFTEGSSAVVLDSDVQIFDAEIAASGSAAGASLTLSRHGGANSNDVFSASGSASFAGGALRVDGSTIGTVSNLAGTLTLSFTGDVNQYATLDLVNSVMRQIAYSNSSDAPPLTAQIDWTFNDGNTGSQGVGGALSVTGSITVNITNVNDTPTGAALIIGDTTQGQTLHVNTNTLADPEGLGVFNYQWLKGGVDISGATSSDYILSEGDVAGAISVRVNYVDGFGASESVTSATTSAVMNVNDSPTGNVTVSGSATQGQTLAAANTLSDLDGLGTISYQWKANGTAIAGATSSTLVLAEAQVGKIITVTASYTDGHDTAESVTSTASTAVANVNDAPTGSVTFSGTATQAQTLTASNTLADIDGLGTIAYQWNADGTAIAGATSSTFVLTESQVGKTVTVTASYADAHGTAESVTSTASQAVANLNDAPSGNVTISGTATQGQTLTAANTLADADGLGTVAYQWASDGAAITGATTSTLLLAQSQVGKAIAVTASYTDGHGTAESVASSATGNVANAANAANTAPTFAARSGQLTTDFGIDDTGSGVTLQADGKIVVVGTSGNNFALARYNADGTLDATFDTDGKVTTAFGVFGYVSSVTMQTDGKIVVTGTSYNGSDRNFALARYNTNGGLDTSFGTSGKVTTDFGSNDFGNSVTMQTDGKIVVAGHSNNTGISSSSSSDFSLTRYEPNGTLDTSFGTEGKVTTDIGFTDFGNSVTVQTDGKIVVTGTSYNGINYDFALALYNADGTLDTTFDTDGKVTTDFGMEDFGNSVTIQADGKILVAGSSLDANITDFALARYNPNGTLDTSFGTGGKLTSDFGTVDYGNSVALQADGKIVVTGLSYNTSNPMFALARYNIDGSPDTSFGIDGKVNTDYGLGRQGSSVVIQVDGKIVVAGSGSNGGFNSDFALARYNMDGSLDLSFNAGGNLNTLDGNPTYTGKKPDPLGKTAVMLDSDVAVYDNELSNGKSYSGATLTLARHGGANPNDVFSPHSGTLSALTTGSYFSVNGVAIGLVIGNSNGTLQLGFNSNATQGLVNQTMHEIAYDNTASIPPVSVQIDWTFNDGNTGDQGSGGSLSVVGSTVVNITARNVAPVVVNALADVSILSNRAFSYRLPSNAFADANEGTTLRYNIGTVMPSWLEFDPATATFHGNPGTYGPFDVSKFDIEVYVIDNVGASASDVFRLSVVSNTAPTGAVTITGNTSLGQVLTAANTLADLDGLGTISYQWRANDTAIGGATSSTLTLTDAQVGKTISVIASYTDGFGTPESLTSTPTASVTVDSTQPTATGFSPADAATAVPIGATLVITFNEAIQLGGGTITIKTDTGSVYARYDAATSTNLAIQGNTLLINPTYNLNPGSHYRVELDAGSVTDLAGNHFAGGSDYDFSTGVRLSVGDSVVSVYTGMFNRAPDQQGLQFWQDAVYRQTGLELGSAVSDLGFMRSMVQQFAQFPTYYVLYKNLNDTDFVKQLYLNLQNRTADAGSLNYWVGRIDGSIEAEDGPDTRETVTADFIYGTLAADIGSEFFQTHFDQATLKAAQVAQDAAMNKIEVAKYYTQVFGALSNYGDIGASGHFNSNPASPTYEADARVLQAWLETQPAHANSTNSIATVTDDFATVPAAMAGVDALYETALHPGVSLMGVNQDNSEIAFG